MGAHAATLTQGIADPGFRELLSRIDDEGVWHGGNEVELYCDGDRAVDAMIAALEQARDEVLVEAYIFIDDATGRRVGEALAATAARGVRVRVLADAIGSFKTPDAFWRSLAERGVEVRLFHRLLASPWWHSFRDHRKVLVVDRRLAFTGGMNIADEYASFNRLHKLETSMRDTHLRLIGPAAVEMAAVFSEGWERAGGTALEAVMPPPTGDGGAEILVLESRPGRGHRETAAALAAIVAAARQRIWLTNGYFAPGRLAVALLGRAAQRGVDVRLLLPGRTDVPMVRHAGHGWFARLLRRGVRLWEYQPAVLHAKTVVADGRLSVVGSTNLDFRSFRFNAECNVVVDHEPLAGELERVFLEDLEDSVEITAGAWRRRSPAHRLGDRLAGMLTPLL